MRLGYLGFRVIGLGLKITAGLKLIRRGLV